ncbi:MAG TPA: hypothetical protein VKR61_16330 [Bryobacteraceae bacterium]|nr:hypothetical protein [Bryobacteraceae bacterium]
MKTIAIVFLSLGIFCSHASAAAVTATYTNSNQNVTLTGLGGTGGVGQSSVEWGACSFDGTNTNCIVTAPYTGVGGGGTITITLSYGGNGPSPFLANSTSPGSDLITFGILPGNSGKIVVSLQESTGANVTFLSDNFVFFYSSATCTGVPAGSCAVGQVGLTPNATISGPVHGTFDATPNILAAISASSYGGFAALAPSTWVEVYGTNLANVLSQTWGSADFNGNNAPTALGGTTITIGGQPAFVDFVSPNQANAQVPSNLSPGPQPVVVSTPGGTSVAYTVTVNATEPGMLAPAVFKLPAGQYIGALFPDYSTFVLPPGSVNGVQSARAKPGDTIILYGIGFGPVTPDNPAGILVTAANQITGTLQISFAGTPATVNYDGLTGGFIGLYQFNVVVPNVAANDLTPLTFSLNGNPGIQTLLVAIGN